MWLSLWCKNRRFPSLPHGPQDLRCERLMMGDFLGELVLCIWVITNVVQVHDINFEKWGLWVERIVFNNGPTKRWWIYVEWL